MYYPKKEICILF